MGRSSKVTRRKVYGKSPGKAVLDALDAINFNKVADDAKKLMEPVGKKLDVGKSPVTRGVLWYFPRALLAVADVSAYGAEKYDLKLEQQNWKSVQDGFGRYADAEGRHLLKQAIHPFDKESNLRHIQMEAWNALAKLELTLIELEKDGTVNFD